MKNIILFNNKFFIFVLLFLFSFLINQYYGNRGIFPIDSFLIFDSAHNILSGNHPFKDYWLITGPFLDYMQALFFLIFKVNWFSYVFHASLLNALLTLYSFYFFTKIGLKNLYAFIYSIGVAILAYPPAGTPFIDTHAIIFSVFSLYSFSLAVLLKKNLFWFLTPVFLIFSFFSKQIPSPYLTLVFIVITIFSFFFTNNINKKNLIYLFLGIIFTSLLIFSIFLINQIPIQNFLIQYIYYPFSLGSERISELNLDFNNLVSQFKFIYFALIPLIIATFFLFKNDKNLKENKQFIISLIFLISVLIFIYFQLLTKNQIFIFFLIPISAAYSHAYIIKYFNKKYLIYFILLIFIFSTTKYHVRFNHHKKFMELANVDFNLAENASKIDMKLRGLKWITPYYPEKPLYEINLLIDTKKFLSKINKEKIIITDYQFFSSLLDNKLASPNKWYDNLSIPKKESKYYKIHKDFFLKKIKINKIKYMYFIGAEKHTMNFFDELSFKNKCIISKNINELLIEFNLNECDKIL
tara:strand:+ start:5871 stop:7442 length:1572 start_codon:yes stop_codon:yes gene_type:complete